MSRPFFTFEYALPRSRAAFVDLPSPGTVAADVWHHVTAVATSEGMTIYTRSESLTGQDGAEADTSLPVSALTPGSSTLYLGWWSGNDGMLSGTIDDVSIYARALTAAEVAVLDASSPSSH